MVTNPASKDAPLECKVVGEKLVVSIGIDTLAYAFLHGPEGDRMRWDDDLLSYDESKLQIIDQLEFAKDVVHALLCEKEDGSSPLTDLIDAACVAAVNDGSLGVDFGAY